jgi:predicted outer membrane protein
MKLQASLLAAALALVPAFARADDAKKHDKHPSPTETAAGGDTAKREKLTDAQVLQRLHPDNQEEVKAGKLAQKKGMSSDVKEFGRMLEQDHSKADQEVKEVAATMRVDLDKLDPEMKQKMEINQRKMEQLEKMSGRDFDRGFAQMMLNGHREAIDMVKSARTDAKGEMKDLLDKTLPVLQHHEDKAKEILKKAGDTASIR